MFLHFIISTLICLSLAGKSWRWQTGNMQDSAEETSGTFIGTAPACSAHSSDCAARGQFYWYSVTSGNGHFCSSGRKVYCNDFASPYSNIYWKGTATFCQGECSDCSGTDACIALDGSGDGSDCSCSLFCTNQKAMCVQYRSRRLGVTGPRSPYMTATYTGIEIGFFLSFGEEFDEPTVFEDTVIDIGEFIECTAEVLDAIHPGIDVHYDIGHVLDYGLTHPTRTGNYSGMFEYHNHVPFINVRYDIGNEEDAQIIYDYLDNFSNQQQLAEDISDKLSASNTWSDHEYVVFVESNMYITSVDDICPNNPKGNKGNKGRRHQQGKQ